MGNEVEMRKAFHQNANRLFAHDEMWSVTLVLFFTMSEIHRVDLRSLPFIENGTNLSFASEFFQFDLAFFLFLSSLNQEWPR